MDKAMWLALAVVALLAPAKAQAAITCQTVENSLSPCLNYVISGGVAARPPTSCCEGIRSLYNQARATADRQAVCYCLKSVAGSVPQNIIKTAAALPGKCGVSIPYDISPSTDCSKVV